MKYLKLFPNNFDNSSKKDIALNIFYFHFYSLILALLNIYINNLCAW